MIIMAKHVNSKNLNISKTNSKVGIEGFVFPHQLLQDIRLYNEGSTPLTASALTVYLTMLSECDELGYLYQYNLSKWAKSLNITYSTMDEGRRKLLTAGFIKEVILNGYPVYKIIDYDRYREPEKYPDVDLNYFHVPHKLFKTTILKKLVHTSCYKGIMFLLQLLNQFRTKFGFANYKELVKYTENIEQDYTMKRLKNLISPSAKKVREVLDLIKPLFIQSKKEEEVRGEGKKRIQVRLKKVFFSVSETIVKEKSNNLETEQLLAKYRKELAYRLIGLKFHYSKQDLFDTLNAFKQEVVDVVQYVSDLSIRNQFIHDLFFDTLDSFELRVVDMKENNREFKFTKSIGAYFRSSFKDVFSKQFASFFIENRELIHQAITQEFTATGKPSKLLDKMKNVHLFAN